jgi:hypothetical protein
MREVFFGVGICKQITIIILHEVISRLLAPLRFNDSVIK